MNEETSPRGIVMEWDYLRREMLLREVIQALSLLILAIMLGVTLWGVLERAWGSPLPFLAAATCLAGIWAHNDNLELRMGCRLRNIESALGIGWESWLKSSAARLKGPIGSGHQLSTRGAFLGSSLLVMIVAWADGSTGFDLFWSGVSFAIMLVLLVPPRVVAGKAGSVTA